MSTLSRRLARIGRLAVAPFKGFFITSLKAPRRKPARQATFWAHTWEVIRVDFADAYAPCRYAMKEFKEERARLR